MGEDAFSTRELDDVEIMLLMLGRRLDEEACWICDDKL